MNRLMMKWTVLHYMVFNFYRTTLQKTAVSLKYGPQHEQFLLSKKKTYRDVDLHQPQRHNENLVSKRLSRSVVCLTQTVMSYEADITDPQAPSRRKRWI